MRKDAFPSVRLQKARTVTFPASNANAITYTETGIVLRFVRGYSEWEIRREQRRRRERSAIYEIVQDDRRFNRGLIPLRKLDREPYALVLYFEHIVNRYVTRWIKTRELSTSR